jgi:Do/DeqQ family serine protease
MGFAAPSGERTGMRTSYADVVSAVAPAVVTIRVEGRAEVSQTSVPDSDLLRRFFGDQFGGAPQEPRSSKQRGLGSGVIVSPDGYIMTNDHVVGRADDIRVELIDGRMFKARLIGSDSASDVALLKIDADGLRSLPLGNSDAVQVGDVVLAIGNPLGIGQTVTMGIISGKGRSTGVADGGYEDFLQTDAPINQGNSGGALVNLKGELVGLNSQILSPSGGNIGIGFAIPANMARHVMTLLRTEGRVRRAQLGLTVQAVTSDMAASLGLKNVSGAIVSAVTPGSAADHAGVKRGDVIVSLDGRPIADSNSLRNRISEARPGSRATLIVIRDNSQREISVTLGEALTTAARGGESPGAADGRASLSMAVVPLTAELARELDMPADARGLLVQSVEPDSRAAGAGIQAGDVIEEVNQQPVRSVAALQAAVHRDSSRPLLVLVNRDGRELFLTAGAS